MDQSMIRTVILMAALVVVFGALLLAALSVQRLGRLRELAYRERMAMIERGMTPPPDPAPPQMVERRKTRTNTFVRDGRARYRSAWEQRVALITAGVILACVGAGVAAFVGEVSRSYALGGGIGGGIALGGLVVLLAGLVPRLFGTPPWEEGDRPE